MRGKKKRKGQAGDKRKKAGTGREVSASKAFIATLAVLAVGGGAYLAYNRMRRGSVLDSNSANEDTIIINNHIPQTTSSKTAAVGSRGDAFPLKRGSRGSRVTQLQQALANRIGIDQMNANGGIDGKFGPGTANALKIAGYGEVVDEIMFQSIVGKSSVTSSTSMLQAKALYDAARAKNVDLVLQYLRGLNSPSDYSEVNAHYKQIKLVVGRTIVTDLLNYAFADNESAKAAIKNEFLRIGLKVNSDGVWSLQGVPVYRDVITLRTTFVVDGAKNRIPVKKNTILGEELRVANGITWVRAIDNKVVQVPTQDVKYA